MAKPKLQGDKWLSKARGAEPLDTTTTEVEVIPEIPTIASPDEAIALLRQYHGKVMGEFQLAYRRSLPWARLAGAVLSQVKMLLPHGEFLAWVEANVDISPRQCQTYMAIARGWDEVLASNTNFTSHLPPGKEPTISQAAAAVVAWERDRKGPTPSRSGSRERRLTRAIVDYLAALEPQNPVERSLERHLRNALEVLRQVR